jgi:hypothetical protein
MNNQKSSDKAVSSTKGIYSTNPHALLRLIIESNKQTIAALFILLGVVFFAKLIISQNAIDSMHTYSGKLLTKIGNTNETIFNLI